MVMYEVYPLLFQRFDAKSNWQIKGMVNFDLLIDSTNKPRCSINLGLEPFITAVMHTIG